MLPIYIQCYLCDRKMAPDHRNTETGHLEFIIDIQFMCTLQETNIAMDMAHLYTDDLPVLPINMGISIAMEDQEIVRTFHLQSRFQLKHLHLWLTFHTAL